MRRSDQETHQIGISPVELIVGGFGFGHERRENDVQDLALLVLEQGTQGPDIFPKGFVKTPGHFRRRGIAEGLDELFHGRLVGAVLGGFANGNPHFLISEMQRR